MGRSIVRGFRHWHEVILAGMIAALLGWAAIVDPSFLQPAAQTELSTHVWEMALLAVPMTLIIITAGIDLSIGSAMALSAVILGLCYEAGASYGVCVLAALLTGVAAGALNGLFVAKVRVHPLIVTLATYAAFRGIAEGISHARPISGFPPCFSAIGCGSVLGVPVPALIFAAAALAAAVALTRTSFGRAVYSIGGGERAARLSGIAVERVKLLLYTLSGSAAGLAAVMFVARRNTAKADIATGMELDVITAVVLGGTSIFGGKGSILGTILGVLLIHETREWVSWRWNQDELNAIVIGAMLVVSVLAYTIADFRLQIADWGHRRSEER